MRSRLDDELEQLNTEMIRMGALCEEAVKLSISAFVDNDLKLATEVIALDNEIDQKELEIESICMRLLLQHQPVARDLRQISAAFRMITDMERIGDHAVNIAEWVQFSISGVHEEVGR